MKCPEEILDWPPSAASFNLYNDDSYLSFELWGQATECYKCSLYKYAALAPLQSVLLMMNTTYSTVMHIIAPNNTGFYNFTYKFHEYGKYSLHFSSKFKLSIKIDHTPPNYYLPIIVAIIFFVSLFLIWQSSKFLLEKMNNGSDIAGQDIDPLLSTPSTSVAETGGTTQSSGRLKCIDIFRGITVTLMIFVNYGGGGYYFFLHTSWNGLTIADLVFPWFLWIMGMSMALSFKKQFAQMSRCAVFAKIVKRSLILFVLGLTVNSIKVDNFENFRIFGVLQRISLCYFISSMLEVLFSYRTEIQRQHGLSAFIDIIYCWKQWFVIILLQVVYLCITLYLRFPGCPSGYLGPGGMHFNGIYENCTGGAAGFIDNIIFGKKHLLKKATCFMVYNNSVSYDPEGLLGILSACLTVQLGVAAGRILIIFKEPSLVVVRWIVWAIINGLLAGLLCYFSKETGFIPVNKNLWSLSYVFVTSSFAFMLIACIYSLCDNLNIWEGRPFKYAGMNPIFLYVGHEFTKKVFPWSWHPITKGHGEFLFMNVFGTALWIIIAYYCYKKKIFLSV